MTIPTSHLYIGSALYQLLSTGKDMHIESFPTTSNNSFLVNKTIGLYIKYSAKTISPWNFTFKKVHQEELRIMNDIIDKVYIVFVCGKDGISCISYEDSKYLLDDIYENAEWIRFSRTGSKRYKVTGKDGKLPFKLTIKSFPNEIINLLK